MVLDNKLEEGEQMWNSIQNGPYVRPMILDPDGAVNINAMKDEAGSNLKNKENNFMHDNSYGDETMEELTAAVMLMARIQPTDGNAETVPSYDAKAVSEVNASSKVHEQMRHEKRKTIIQTSDDDKIDSISYLMIHMWKIMVAHLTMIQMIMTNIIKFKC
nr:hypothetical protein [Tanacetum cinerariifolium]